MQLLNPNTVYLSDHLLDFAENIFFDAIQHVPCYAADFFKFNSCIKGLIRLRYDPFCLSTGSSVMLD